MKIKNQSILKNKTVYGKIFIFLIAWFTFYSSIYAIEPVVLTEDKGEYPLGLYLEILEDKEGKLTIEDVQKPEMEKLWVRSDKEVPSFGYSESVFWLRFKIENKLKSKEDWLLDIAFPPIDYIDYYHMEDNGKYTLIQTGDRRLFHSRQYDNKNYLFKVEVNPNNSRFIYLKTWSFDGLHESIPLTLYNKDTYIKTSSINDTFFGIYVGIISVMMFYNFFIFLSVRDKTYLYYILYLFFYLFWVFIYYGYAYKYLWQDNSWWANQSITLTNILFVIMLVLFTRSFLSSRDLIPRLDFILRLILFLYSSYLVLSFVIGYAAIWRIIMLTQFILCIIILFAAIQCLRKGSRTAKYYLLAWSFLISGGMLLLLKISSIIPSNFFTEKSFILGCSFEVILLSLGLADRINELKKKNEIIQIENQKELEKLNNELEKKVLVRTEQLNEMLDQLGKMYVDSEAKRKEIEALAESRKKLSFVGTMAAGIVHDIKNPMATIKALAEMSNSETITPKKREKNLNIIIREMDRLNDLAYEILDFSKDELHLNLEDVNIKDFILEIEQFLSIDFKYSGIDYSSEIEYEGFAQIDKGRMRRVIVNLAKNAIEAMQDGSKKYKFKIRVESIPQNPPLGNAGVSAREGLTISLTDNGSGIPESVQTRIFQAFATEGKANGTGLGLFMCKMIVEAHNGRLTYETKLGEGTSFFITLPEFIGEEIVCG
ncbi:MAG TPA: sensor histidine kinase [Leptospiraceae bacterium]|nr:sensor histidine kinase [Leptospiraceae bacterium]HMW05069.1 sensor histidine kinase [Leptospiraceae bacterium]HMX34016.1 sensor histidine kinase [Leptospiraceae bacterium]HMY31634.1 sensor histidine kinase [Leptospiraceae bacterium]HNA07995.1 sensor histidine kinase [Leptospiraceae bacterium]